MFHKLVSNLAFSPALITELGFYARRLRQEEITRRLTVLFIVLTLIMQSLAVFSPPESANASNQQDIIRGGVSSLEDFLLRYDNNEEDIKDIYSATGITRAEITNMRPSVISTDDKENIFVMSRYGQLANTQNEVSMAYSRSSGGTGVRYFSQMSTSGEYTKFDGWVGHSVALGWFGIIKNNGSLATQGAPISISSVNSSAIAVTKSITAINLSREASQITSTDSLKPFEKVSYSLKVSNPDTDSITTPINVRIADLLEYSTLIDGGGGAYNQETGTLSWPQVQLAPGQSQERTFTIQLLSTIPSTATGASYTESYDCKLSVTFGNQVKQPVDCPQSKTVEGILSLLPTTGSGPNIIFTVVILIIIGFFFIRTRQLKKEVRIIRHNFNAGII